MKYKYCILYILSIPLLLTGCEKVLDLDLDEQEPQVVVMSSVEQGRPIGLRLTYSRFFLSSAPFRTIDDAVVTLKVNGIDANATVTSDGGNYTLGYQPQEGDRLDLRVAVPGYEAVTATTTIPKAPRVLNVRGVQEENHVDVHFTLDDPEGEDDYYFIRVKRITTYTAQDSTLRYDTSYSYFVCYDYMLTGNGDVSDVLDGDEAGEWSGYRMAFTDGNISGRSHEVELTVSRWGNDSLLLEVTSCSRDRYLYELTSELYSDDPLDQIFTEPVQIHTNIDGGIGIFAAQNRIVLPIPIQP